MQFVLCVVIRQHTECNSQTCNLLSESCADDAAAARSGVDMLLSSVAGKGTFRSGMAVAAYCVPPLPMLRLLAAGIAHAEGAASQLEACRGRLFCGQVFVGG